MQRETRSGNVLVEELAVGLAVDEVGLMDEMGLAVDAVGLAVRLAIRLRVGLTVGLEVGLEVELVVGLQVGLAVGTWLGLADGLLVGLAVRLMAGTSTMTMDFPHLELTKALLPFTTMENGSFMSGSVKFDNMVGFDLSEMSRI